METSMPRVLTVKKNLPVGQYLLEPVAVLWCICPLFWKLAVSLQTHNHLPEPSHPMDMKTLSYLWHMCQYNKLFYLQSSVFMSYIRKDLSHMTKIVRLTWYMYCQFIYKIMWNSHFNKLPRYEPLKIPNESSRGLNFIVRFLKKKA
jgi:hypothetical protein